MINIKIPGNPRTKKNSQRIVRNGKRNFILPSKAFMDYQEQCGYLIPSKYRNISLASHLNIKVVYYMGTRHKVDLTNLLSATMDILVKYSIIEDDNKDIAHSNNGSIVRYDKINPRCEIEIADLDNHQERINYNTAIIKKLTKQNEQLFVVREERMNKDNGQLSLEDVLQAKK